MEKWPHMQGMELKAAYKNVPLHVPHDDKLVLRKKVFQACLSFLVGLCFSCLPLHMANKY